MRKILKHYKADDAMEGQLRPRHRCDLAKTYAFSSTHAAHNRNSTKLTMVTIYLTNHG